MIWAPEEARERRAVLIPADAVPAAFFGLLTPFVFIMGAEPFEVHGQNSPKVIVASSLAIALYSAACQF